jgi:hypothetical protein
VWVIQYNLLPPCWLSRSKTPTDITWQLKNARQFANRDEANLEIHRIGLPGVWVAVDIGEVHAERKGETE